MRTGPLRYQVSISINLVIFIINNIGIIIIIIFKNIMQGKMSEDSINEFKAKPLVLVVYELDPEYGWILATAIEVTSLSPSSPPPSSSSSPSSTSSPPT